MSCGTRAHNVHPGDPDGARLLRSFPLESITCPTGTALPRTTGHATCWWPATAPLFDSQPRRPSCVCSGLEPHCRTSRCARPQPTPSPRCCSMTSLLVLRHCTCWYCSWRPLILRATRSGRQSRRRRATALASELHHRTVLRTALACTAARQFISAGPCSISATRETITTTQANVYSGHHRFFRAAARENLVH